MTCSSNSENTHHGCHQIPKLSFSAILNELSDSLSEMLEFIIIDIIMTGNRINQSNDRWKLKFPYKTKTYVVLSWLLPSAAVSIVSAYSKLFLGCGDVQG